MDRLFKSMIVLCLMTIATSMGDPLIGAAQASQCPFKLRPALAKLADMRQPVMNHRKELDPLNRKLARLRADASLPDNINGCSNKLKSELDGLRGSIEALEVQGNHKVAETLRICAFGLERRIAKDLHTAEAAKDVDRIVRLTQIRKGIIELSSGSIRLAQDMESIVEKTQRLLGETKRLRDRCNKKLLDDY